MWWRRCNTAHTLVMIFANCFVTLAISCKIFEVYIDINIYNSISRQNEQNIITIIINKLIYSGLYNCTNKYLKKIKLFYFF